MSQTVATVVSIWCDAEACFNNFELHASVPTANAAARVEGWLWPSSTRGRTRCPEHSPIGTTDGVSQ